SRPRSPTPPGAPSPSRSPTASACAWPCSTCCSAAPRGPAPERVPDEPAAPNFTKHEKADISMPESTGPHLIRGARPLGGDPVDLLFVDGKIAAIGPDLEAPEGARTVDATGLIALPG